mmetsp:Transcript_2623/g.3772  ORF Transcript_2623/g.3772 Transcript_2623/m.3772 type:complete len:336 (-) Transcript_2623:2-1009(-)
MVTIHSQNHSRSYSAGGLGLIIVGVIYLGALLLAYFLALYTGDLWKKVGTISTQPRFRFSQKAIVTTYTQTPGAQKIWTTSRAANSFIPQSKFVFPSMSVQTLEETGYTPNVQMLKNMITPAIAPKVDTFKFHFEIPMNSATEEVRGFEALLFFQIAVDTPVMQFNDAGLLRRLYLEWEAVAHISASTPAAASSLRVIGAMEPYQRRPINYLQKPTTFNDTLIALEDVKSISDIDIGKIMEQVIRNEETSFFSPKMVRFNQGNTDSFVVDIDINIPEWVMTYQPNFLETLKFGYMQYVLVAAPFLAIAMFIVNLLIQTGLIKTVVTDRVVKKKIM